ncbi:MAG TPA: 4-phosphoerythronate dehydrogenase [Gammaproteobacteria bacterium]|nr:4-phosphoerythronate dehydrogenase [Gammaproteobacteria bacterium]
MKIVADENIPLVEHYFGESGELILKSGRAIQRSDVIDADILLVRSVTRVDETLLKNTAVKFVGSATSGADHLDTVWLDQEKIRWCIAAGCNAMAVAEYVICVIAALQKMDYLRHQKIRAGVVGVGRIGSLVAEKLAYLGWEIVLCDPFRKDILSTPFEELADLDFITFHTPLTRTGLYPTYHLVQKNFLEKQKKNCILLNAGRGDVFSFEALKQYGRDIKWCLDVWEGEPIIDQTVLENALIATPHIAGYSRQGKIRGTDMIYQQAMQQTVSEIIYPTRTFSVSTAKDWRDVVLNIFDPVVTTNAMKKNPEHFDELRKKYADRDEFGFVTLDNMRLPEADVLLLKKLAHFF